MKFFTKKMWLGLQDDEKTDYWERIWKKNIKRYSQYLNKIKPKISSKMFRLFSKHHFNGEYILNINIINKGKAYIQKETKELHLRGGKNEIIIKTLCPTKKIYFFKYKDVRKYIIDYPSNLPLGFDNGCDSWGYDELDYLKDGYFRHEILLHSGATILIEFKQFSYSCTKINKRNKGTFIKV